MQQRRSTWRLPLRLGLVAPTVAVVVLASTVGYADAGQDEPERQERSRSFALRPVVPVRRPA